MKKIKILNVIVIFVVGAVIFSQCNKDKEIMTTISGTIINSQTGSGLSNATLSFYDSADKSGDYGDAVFQVTTDEYGNYYTEEAVVGTFILVITAPNFIDYVISGFVISEIIEENVFPPMTLVQELGTDGVLRVVLTWGESPYDLDSHLTGPISGTSDRFHMYFSDQSPVNSNANLDVDDTYSYGPETTTIISYTDGVYRYSVHNYSNSSETGAPEIYNSPATVSVYDANGLIKTYTAPSAGSTAGDTWVVFEINVSGGVPSIVDKNYYTLFGDAYSVTKIAKK